MARTARQELRLEPEMKAEWDAMAADRGISVSELIVLAVGQLRRNGRRRLTAEQVTAIRQDARNVQAIADEYGVHNSTVSRIKKNLLWQSNGGAE